MCKAFCRDLTWHFQVIPVLAQLCFLLCQLYSFSRIAPTSNMELVCERQVDNFHGLSHLVRAAEYYFKDLVQDLHVRSHCETLNYLYETAIRLLVFSLDHPKCQSFDMKTLCGNSTVWCRTQLGSIVSKWLHELLFGPVRVKSPS